MTDIQHAILRLSGEKGYQVQSLPNDIWEFWKGPGMPIKTAYCARRALEWISSVNSPQTGRRIDVPVMG